MKKTTRRVFSLVLCVCLIMAMAIPAFAVSDTHNGTYNGQGYVATYSGTKTSFSATMGSSSTYTLKASVTYTMNDSSGTSTRTVNSPIQKTYTEISQSINGEYTAFTFKYFMDGNTVYTKNVTP